MTGKVARQTSDRPLVLVDGSSYLFRAFHALPHLTSSKGEPSGAIYGVVNMLRKLLNEYDPENIAIIFDAGGKTFRNELYGEYKAHRPPVPPELKAQFEPLNEVIQSMGLPVLRVPDVEADDVIGTLAQQAAQQSTDVLIISGDKDLMQLVSERIKMVDTMKGVTYDEAGVVARFGVAPNQMIDYLALVGDSSDNVPGVPNVGPKTAVKWLQQYGSLDEIIAHADDIKGKVGDNLRAALSQLDLSRQLVTLRCDVPLEQTAEALARRAPDDVALAKHFARFEFKNWLAETGGAQSVANAAGDASPYEMITTTSQLDVWLKRLEKAPLIAFDTETTSLDVMNAELVGISFTDGVQRGAYIPLAHQYEGAPTQLERDAVIKKLKPLLEDEAQPKVGQNFKYDINVFAHYGVVPRGVAYDTMLESYVLDSVGSRHDMDGLALKYLSYKTISYEEIAGKGKAQITFDRVPIEKAATYAAEDADITFRLHEMLWPKLQKLPKLVEVFKDIEMPLLPILAGMERRGVMIDAAKLHAQSSELESEIRTLQQEAYHLAESEFNLDSPKQIQEILFSRMKLPVLKKTPKGQPSTAENVLEELARDYPLPKVILRYRSLSKLKSTYTDKLPGMINARTGRVHTSYHQAVTATGRLSSSDPNLQNIPVRTEAGRRIRNAFVAPPGYLLLAVDYSQIELRIMAHLSDDERLTEAFMRGEDVHRATAAEVFGVTPDTVTADMRRHAKAINFGLIYGMSPYGLARELDIEHGAARDYVERYFDRYPGVRAYMDRTRELARTQGFVETHFGRRLYLPEINSSNHVRRQYAERTAINAPMQGTAADLIKLAMIAADRWIRATDADVHMIMQVHDELVFEVKQDQIDDVKGPLTKCMVEVAALKVPLAAGVGVGPTWGEAH